jgi:hypothetical protein
VLLSSGRIEDGLYVVVQNNTVDSEVQGDITTIRFNTEHVGYVKDLDVFSPWYQIEFRSADSKHALMPAFGPLPPNSEQRAFWTLLRDKKHVWIYVGTQAGLTTIKQQQHHKVGDYVLEFPP